MSAFDVSPRTTYLEPVVAIDESELDNGFTAAEVFSNAECLGLSVCLSVCLFISLTHIHTIYLYLGQTPEQQDAGRHIACCTRRVLHGAAVPVCVAL